MPLELDGFSDLPYSPIMSTAWHKAIVGPALLALLLISTVPLGAQSRRGLCALTRAPAELQSRLQTDFSSWKVQEVANLSAHAKVRWQSEKPLGCPGIAVGRFEAVGRQSYAILLVPIKNPDEGYRLLVFTPVRGQSPGHLTVVEQSNQPGSADLFIHTIEISKVFSAEWRRKLRATTKDGLLVVDSGDAEYEADVYFRSGGRYRHEPIDY